MFIIIYCNFCTINMFNYNILILLRINIFLQSGEVIPMPVPSSYNDITVSSSLRDHVGVVWYDRTFYIPDSWRQQGYRVWLRFGSVHYFAQVVNN